MIEVSKKFEIYWKHILQSRPNHFFRERVRAIDHNSTTIFKNQQLMSKLWAF